MNPAINPTVNPAVNLAGSPAARPATAARLNKARPAFNTASWAAQAPSEPPTWVELIPTGSFRGRDGRGPFHVDDPKAVIDATQALRMDAGIPIDYDHATDFAAPNGQPAPAAGWIKELKLHANSIWGRVEWTSHGADAIRTREYRYISPVFQFARDGAVVRLLRAGLTNNPNLYLTAICAVNDKEGAMDSLLLAQLREMLGAGDDATADDMLAQIRDLLTAANDDDGDDGDGTGDAGEVAISRGADPARYVAMAQFQRTLTELNQLRAERGRERAEHAVDTALRSGKLIPAQREWAVAYCQADGRGFAQFIGRQPAILGPSHDHESAREQAPRRASELLTPDETAICSQLGVRPEDFRKRSATISDFLKLNKVFD
jgi:phage I-like protein